VGEENGSLSVRLDPRVNQDPKEWEKSFSVWAILIHFNRLYPKEKDLTSCGYSQ
jgi:hypothetical protein